MTRHAVVVGASVAGLLAARVLARHFDEATIVERDAGDAVFDDGRDMRWYHHGVWKLRHASGPQIHSQMRSR